MYDSIPLVIDSEYFKKFTQQNNELNYMLPIFIIVMVGGDLYLFFNKNITSQEITKILKNILVIEEDVELTPTIELPAVSVDAPLTYKGQEIPNITDIEKIYDWTLYAPSKELYENLFTTKLKDPFQHISKRFIKFKKTGYFSATFANDIYSGEISDTIPLDKIKEFSLTKHVFTSPTPNVVTERFKKLMSRVEQDQHWKLQNLVAGLVKESQNPPQTELYKKYIPDKKLDLIVQLRKPETTQVSEPPKESIHISDKLQENLQIKRKGNRRGSLFGLVSSSDLIAKNVLNSINYDTGDDIKWDGMAVTFTPLPAGWLDPKPSADTSIVPAAADTRQ
jgi:hypothetical protein